MKNERRIVKIEEVLMKAKVMKYYKSKGISVDINSFTERELRLKAELIDLIEEIKDLA